ncbi:ABC transporter permease [Mucilaginibacter koreensis]
MFTNYLTTIFRNLLRNKISTLINVTGLAVSLACCIFVYAFLRHENSFDSNQPNASRTYRMVGDLQTAQGTEHQGWVHFPLGQALRNDFPQVENVTQIYAEGSAIIAVNKTGNKNLFEQKGLVYADENFLKMFRHPLLAGTYNHLLTHPDEVILTKTVADKVFGGRDKNNYTRLLDKTITVNKNTYRISGIMDNIPANTNVPFKVLLPYSAFLNSHPGIGHDWKSLWGSSFVFITLPQGADVAAINKQLVAFKNKYFEPATAKKFTYHLQPLNEVHTNEMYEGTSYATPKVLVIAFITMGIIVLLTACINFINLATAQAVKRAKEIGIRKTLGSSRSALMIRFMSETFVLVLFASTIGLLLANYALHAFNSYLINIIDLGLSIDYTVIYFLAAIIVLTSVLAGYYPAKIMSGYQPVQALKNTLSSTKSGFASKFSLRKILVVTQFTISQLLIIGTLVIASQMQYFQKMDLGYRKSGMMVLDVPENNSQQLEVMRNQLLKLPAVQDVSFSSTPPTSNVQSTVEFSPISGATSEKMSMERKHVDDHYIPVYHIKLMAGRNLQPSDKLMPKDTSGRYNALVNQKALQALGIKDPQQAIGQTIMINQKEKATIIGVTADFFNVPVKHEVTPCMLFYSTGWVGIANVQFKTSQTVSKSTLNAVQQIWQQTFPDHVFKGYNIDTFLKHQAFYVIEDVMYQAFKIFVALSVFIGCLGLYGLISYLALQRQKEIGIRKVLGSSVNSIVLMFSKEFAWLVFFGFMIAAPLAYLAMSTWLESFAHRIALSPAYFAGAFFISLIIAGFTISFQMLNAALANPIRSLKAE